MNKQTVQLLEQHFDIAFAAPDGIARLRELILTLAMQGKLVDQDPNDPPASELLKEIEAEKQRLVKAGKIKKPTPLPPIKSEEMPYELPQVWEWVRLGDICSYIQRGKGPKYVDHSTHRVISQKCVRWHGLYLEPAKYIDPVSLVKYEPIRFLRVGDLLWNSTGTGTIGRAALVPKEFEDVEIVADSHVTVVRAIEVSPSFLWRWIQSSIVQNEIEGSASGTTNQIELNTSTVINHLMPLPSLPEQHRIVARIDQLMALCDAMETLRKRREEKRLAVHAASIKQLLDAPDGSARDFIQQHFGELYTVKENVAELRKAILQLAVMGRLVPQDPNDPPACELLKKIEAEKQRLVKAGKIKKPKPKPPIKPEEVPYVLPQGWEWVRLGEIAGFENGDRSKRYPNDNDLQPSGIPFFGAKDMVGGILRFDNGLRFISEAKFEELSNGKLRDNDFVMLLRGTVGKIARFSETTQFLTGFINAQMLIIRQYSTTKFFQELFIQKTTGSAVKQMPANVVAEFLMPFPPLPEQHRIVARIDQLMALCDKLEQQIDATTGKKTELLKAIMAQV